MKRSWGCVLVLSLFVAGVTAGCAGGVDDTTDPSNGGALGSGKGGDDSGGYDDEGSYGNAGSGGEKGGGGGGNYDDGSNGGGNGEKGGGPTAPGTDPDQQANPYEPNMGSPTSPGPGETPQCTAAWAQSQVAAHNWVGLSDIVQIVSSVAGGGRMLDSWMVTWRGHCCYSVRWFNNGHRNDYQVRASDGAVIGRDFQTF